MLDIEKRLVQGAAQTEAALEGRSLRLPEKSCIADAMKYSLLGGGKRIRAFLTREFCNMFGGDEASAEPYASALEMIHAYSLIHDDMPEMDNDDMRRGKPSCHKKFGTATALLAGDALQTLAFETAAEGDNNAALAVRLLAEAAGSSGMCLGQELDLSLDCPSLDALLRLHRLKTGELIYAACALGYYAATEEVSSDVIEKIKKYAFALGLAFQITDDLLDVTSTSDELGKPVGSDAKNGKKTILTFMSAAEAQTKAMQLSREASEVFADYPGSGYVCALPMYLINRKK